MSVAAHGDAEPLRPARGLPPRPAPDPAVVALVAAAVLELWPSGAADGAVGPAGAEDAATRAQLVWRFSGRWWSRALPVRRSRPWTR